MLGRGSGSCARCFGGRIRVGGRSTHPNQPSRCTTSLRAPANTPPPRNRPPPGSQDGRIKVWRLRSGQCLRKFDAAHSQGVTSVALSRDGSQVILGGGGGGVGRRCVKGWGRGEGVEGLGAWRCVVGAWTCGFKGVWGV